MTSHDLAVEYVPVGELRTFHSNPRQGDVARIAQSLRVNGQYRPIVVNRGTHTGRSNEVLAGNHTLIAARDLGWEAVATVVVDVDEDQAARIVVADNRTSDLGTYDDRLLAELLTDLSDLDGTGYDPGDLEDLVAALDSDNIGGLGGLTDPDDVPDLHADVITHPGDLWLLGPHRLVCGSAMNQDHITLATDGAEPDVIHTDPPYGISIVNDSGKVGHAVGTPFGGGKVGKVVPTTKFRPVTGDENPQVAADAFKLLTTLYSDALHVWWGGNHYAASAGLPDASCWLVWDKATGDNTFADAELAWTNYPGAVRLLQHMWSGMLRASERSKRVHPTQKPVALTAWALDVVKAPKQALVLDTFAGSGSTVIACHGTDRVAALIELDPGYCDVICRRYQEHTGTKPTRDGVPYDFTEAAEG